MNYLFTYFKEQNWFDVTSIVTNVQPEKKVLTTTKTCLMLFLLFFFSSFASETVLRRLLFPWPGTMR